MEKIMRKVKKIRVKGKVLKAIELDFLKNLPFSIRILFENVARNGDGRYESYAERLLDWPRSVGEEIPFFPERIILQDFTGVPLICDLAAMREEVKKYGKSPKIINPVKPVDLIIDHSVQVDYFGTAYSLKLNMRKEFERNIERYRFLKWAQKSFKNLRVIPPGKGIIHQINLEYLSSLVMVRDGWIFPETLIGTDSHTTMIGGLGVLGWGVGGIEAECAMLGEPYWIKIPEVVGVELKGKPKPGVTATDIVLYITHTLRKFGVVDKFVEFFGEGVRHLSLPDRATISNMAPEYGSTVGFFPPDEESINYIKLTGRNGKIAEEYLKRQGLFQDYKSILNYSSYLSIDLGEIDLGVAGPSRPHDFVKLKDLKSFGDKVKNLDEFGDGSVVIAAITSCTNTSNPSLMISAGLVTKKCVEYGLKVPSYVKTSLAPGSRAVVEYIKDFLPYFEALGFHVVGFGCTTCIGNSGPIDEKIARVIKEKNLSVAAVLSGNRNFPARIHPLVKLNYLMSPPLVVAFAVAGRIIGEDDIVGIDPNGKEVKLKDILPDEREVREWLKNVTPRVFKKVYKDVLNGSEEWEAIDVKPSEIYEWDEKSTYIRKPPIFDVEPLKDIEGGYIFMILGDSITTDHISPAGGIMRESPAGRYLLDRGEKDLNTYGARRGNHEVMIRGTFQNPRLRNFLVDREGGFTVFHPTGEIMDVFSASQKYKEMGAPLIVIAGKEYGSGSSRDWAAKGPAFLGVKVVIAQSFERIHRSNLIGMGILPLEFLPGDNWQKLGIKGNEKVYIKVGDLKPKGEVEVVLRNGGSEKRFKTIARVDTQIELEYLKSGGIIPYVLKKIIKEN